MVGLKLSGLTFTGLSSGLLLLSRPRDIFFYLESERKIICLCLIPDGDVATGGCSLPRDGDFLYDANLILFSNFGFLLGPTAL